MKHRPEDVEQVVEVLLHEDYRDGVADPVIFAERVLDAVGPSLEKRGAVQALREAAKEIDSEVDWSDGRHSYGDNDGYETSARILRSRADEIEARS